MDTDKRPLVSVIMPSYNAERYVEEAILSVMGQTCPDWELLVIDDGSTDRTRELVEAMARQDTRIRLLPNEENMGTARTRNRGLDLSRGEYVAFLDSDDVWRPDKLEKQIALARAERADLVYSSYSIMDDQGAKRCADYLVPGHTDLKALLKTNVIGCSTVLLSGICAREFRFRPDYYHEDYVLWLTMLRAGKKAAGVAEVLVDYRFHFDSRAGNKIASAKRRWAIYRDYLELPLTESLFYLGCYAVSGLRKYRAT